MLLRGHERDLPKPESALLKIKNRRGAESFFGSRTSPVDWSSVHLKG
jgi:hypothetical protein